MPTRRKPDATAAPRRTKARPATDCTPAQAKAIWDSLAFPSSHEVAARLGISARTVRRWQAQGWTRLREPNPAAAPTPEGLAQTAQHIETKAVALDIRPESRAYALQLAQMSADDLFGEAGRKLLEGVALFMTEATDRRVELVMDHLADTGKFLAACAVGLAAAHKARHRAVPQATAAPSGDIGPDDRLGAILVEFSRIAEKALP